jgi:hypothetical protein
MSCLFINHMNIVPSANHPTCTAKFLQEVKMTPITRTDTGVGYIQFYYVMHWVLLEVWHKRRQEDVRICCTSLNATCFFVTSNLII